MEFLTGEEILKCTSLLCGSMVSMDVCAVHTVYPTLSNFVDVLVNFAGLLFFLLPEEGCEKDKFGKESNIKTKYINKNEKKAFSLYLHPHR